MKKLQLYFLLMIIVLSGCALNKSGNKENNKCDLCLYQLYIDADGNLRDPINAKIISDESEYINDIFNNFEVKKADNPDLKVTVYIHGGLNTFEGATSRVSRIYKEILNDGKYPLFVSWHSGAFTNYSDHLFMLRRGEKAEFLGPVSSPFVFLEDVLRSIARIPASTYNVLVGQNSVLKSIRTQEEEAAEQALGELIKLGFKINRSPNGAGHSFSDWATVWNPVKLVSAPFVDGLGTGAWNSMLRRTDLVLRKDSGFEGENETRSETAVTKFFNRFASTHSEEGVIIIGHSMGTIIANNIIARYQHTIEFNDIVFMAAACKTKDLEYVVAPYLEKNETTNFYSLSLNPYRDISENTFYDFIPRGSLLIWIDQTFGDINSFQDRTAGYWFNIVRGAGEAFKNSKVRERVNLTQFGIRDGTPQEHGDFNDYAFWKKEFWQGQIPQQALNSRASHSPKDGSLSVATH